MLTCLMLISLASAGCITSYVPRELDPALTAPIEDPPLRGPKYKHVEARSIEQSELIRRFNCRMQALRGDELSEICR